MITHGEKNQSAQQRSPGIAWGEKTREELEDANWLMEHWQDLVQWSDLPGVFAELICNRT